MNSRYILATVLLLSASVLRVHAQSIWDDERYVKVSEARVKTLNEFIHRFNGEEIPDIVRQTDTMAMRQMCVAALFDMDWVNLHENRRTALGFIEEVVKDTILLGIHDTSIYAEAHCIFKYGKEEMPISIVLKWERAGKTYYRWTIVGVNGLMAGGVIDTSFYGSLSPIQNELGFMRLDMAFPEMYGFISANEHVDELPYLMALSSSGMVKFVECSGITYHCSIVPGYLFKVEQKNRNTTNSGWLITEVYEADEKLKAQYISLLLGK